MKKLTFKVSSPKVERNVNDLIKDINQIPCRFQLDIENGIVTFENVDDSLINTIVKLIDNYYTNFDISIDNSVENEYIEHIVNMLLKTASWALLDMNISERDIGNFIWTTIDEISMNYNNKNNIPFSIGDVVSCNYGTHLYGEISGTNVVAVVVNINITGMAYLVPITNRTYNLTSHSYLTFTVPNDIIYNTNYTVGGTVLLDKGKYVRPERLRKVIGKTSLEFFYKILHQLATTFDFTDIIVDAPTDRVTSESTTTKVVTKSTSKKINYSESALLEEFSSAFDKLDSKKKVEEQIDSFLTDIGMPTSERMIRQSFIIACNINKITYENVILELHNMYPKVSEDIIKANLKGNFKKWLEQYPELTKKCPLISFMAVLKVFAKIFT